MWHEEKLYRLTQKLRSRIGKRSIGWLLCLCPLFSQGASAETIQLAWDPVQDGQVAVYQVHYGPASGQYNNMVDTAVNTASIQGLPLGSTYYFAVRACDTSLINCSGFSNEVSTTIQIPSPAASFTTNTVAGTAPLTVLFTDTSTGTITGRNWQFHDGDSATDATLVTHTYTVPGTYTAQLSVTGPGGSDTFVASTPIVVQPPSNTDGNGSDGSTGGDGSDGSDDSSNDGSGNDGTGNMYNPAPIDFNAHTLVSFPGQDLAGGAVIEDGGSTLRLTGNTWKRLAYPYTVTGSTVIEFDYRSDLLGEIHGIGFDNGGASANPARFFALEGTQDWGISSYSYPGDGGWVRFWIPVGQHYGGNFDNLVFFMDDDANAAGDARFRNLVVYEE